MNEFLQLNQFTTPAQAVSIEREPELPPPAAEQVQIELLGCPINPAEILLITGRYASKPPLPARLGIEGAGRVIALGAGVDGHGLAEGDLVISLTRSNWTRRANLGVSEVIKLPSGVDPLQASMLKVNPATALLMLTRYVDLQPGDWVIQNAANSGVGHALIQIARARKFRSVNVVRRDGLADELTAAGADVVVSDGPDLAERVAEQTNKAEIKLAIDAVAGAASQRLADCLADGACVVNYGLLSGEPCQIRADQLIFRSIDLRGFWLAKLLGGMPRDAVEALYGELGAQLAAGQLATPIEACYPLQQAGEALSHAEREQRSGKILFTPNPA